MGAPWGNEAPCLCCCLVIRIHLPAVCPDLLLVLDRKTVPAHFPQELNIFVCFSLGVGKMGKGGTADSEAFCEGYLLNLLLRSNGCVPN